MSEPIIRVDNVHKSYLMGKEAAPPCEASRWRSTLAALSASWWPAARARPLLNIIGGLGDPIEAMVALRQPMVRSLGLVLPIQRYGAVLGSPLPLGQSLLLVWPQLTGLIAVTFLLFTLGCVLFQRQEIRA